MVELYIPKEVWERLEDKTIEKNGCGSGWSAGLIPDVIFGLDFTMPCAVHDEMYFLGRSVEDKHEADRVFLNNMLRMVEQRPWYLQGYGKWVAKRYYEAVVLFGASAYWDGKNNKEDMRKV